MGDLLKTYLVFSPVTPKRDLGKLGGYEDGWMGISSSRYYLLSKFSNKKNAASYKIKYPVYLDLPEQIVDASRTTFQFCPCEITVDHLTIHRTLLEDQRNSALDSSFPSSHLLCWVIAWTLTSPVQNILLCFDNFPVSCCNFQPSFSDQALKLYICL